MIRAVVFDLDGTLADTLPDIAAAVNRALSSVGRPAVDDATVLAGVGRGVRHLMKTCSGVADGPDLEALCASFEAFYDEAPADRTVLFADAAEVLEALDAGAIQAVLSNKPTRFCHAILRRLRVLARFAVVLGEDAVPAPKPDARGLTSLLAALGVPPAESLYVGDTPIDVETARAAGVPVAAVIRGYAAPEAVRAARPDRLWDDLRPLPSLLGE